MIEDKNSNLGVSYIIPAYNAENFIGDTIKSIVKYACHAYEIIIVNDGSTDGTLAVVNKLKTSNDSIVVFDMSNSGSAGRARNVGIEHARYDFIRFVDADDLLPAQEFNKEFLQDQVDKNVDIFIGRTYSFTAKKAAWPTAGHESIYQNEGVYHPAENTELIKNAGVWNKFYRLSFLNKNNIRFVEYNKIEDTAFNLECLIKANLVEVRDVPFYQWRKHSNTVSTTLSQHYAIDRICSASYVATLSANLYTTKYTVLVRKAIERDLGAINSLLRKLDEKTFKAVYEYLQRYSSQLHTNNILGMYGVKPTVYTKAYLSVKSLDEYMTFYKILQDSKKLNLLRKKETDKEASLKLVKNVSKLESNSSQQLILANECQLFGESITLLANKKDQSTYIGKWKHNDRIYFGATFKQGINYNITISYAWKSGSSEINTRKGYLALPNEEKILLEFPDTKNWQNYGKLSTKIEGIQLSSGMLQIIPENQKNLAFINIARIEITEVI